MDPLSHAALGASLAAVAAPSRQRRLAAAIGAAAALLPDADALIRSDADPLLVLDYHRHFSHALLFVPIGALIAALMLWPFLRTRLSPFRLYAYAFAGIASAGLLDACTSYGTNLLLPFSSDKVAWNLISVFDPTFTLLLLVPLVLVLRQPTRATLRASLVLAACYLGLGYWQQQRVTANMWAIAAQRGHAAERLTVKPTLGNQFLWRSLYVHDGKVHADATHAGFSLRHYPGESMPLLLTGAENSPPDSQRASEIERFRHFSDGWLVQTGADFIGDARYAMLPTAIDPIWGITWSPTGQLIFISRHDLSPTERRQWLRMLIGASPN